MPVACVTSQERNLRFDVDSDNHRRFHQKPFANQLTTTVLAQDPQGASSLQRFLLTNTRRRRGNDEDKQVSDEWLVGAAGAVCMFSDYRD